MNRNQRTTNNKVKTLEDVERNLQGMLFPKNYQLTLANGQRIYGPTPSANVPQPPKGSEIFVGNLPKTMFEDQLVPLFAAAGPIYKLRLMLDFSGNNRGYAFISFYMMESVTTAIRLFNNYHVNESVKISVYKSVDNCRLFFGNIPRDKTIEEVSEEITRYVDDVVKVIVFREPQNPRLNRGYAFVEFENHAEAAITRRKLTPCNLVLWDQDIRVDWAEPEPIVNKDEQDQISILFLRNIPLACAQHGLRKILVTRLMGAVFVTKIYKKLDYAFVHFSNHFYAQQAHECLQGLTVGGHDVQVTWARPSYYAKQVRYELPKNLCVSVPPRLRRVLRDSKNQILANIRKGRVQQSSDAFLTFSEGSKSSEGSSLYSGENSPPDSPNYYEDALVSILNAFTF